MDMVKYQDIMRRGDAIFLAGGVLFLGNLLAILVNMLFMGFLPIGIVIMGYGAHIQYSANESLKSEILLAIAESRLGSNGETKALLGGRTDNNNTKVGDACPKCGMKSN